MRALRARRGAAALVGVGLYLGVGLAGPAAAGSLPVSGAVEGTGDIVSQPCIGLPDSADIGLSFRLTGALTSLGDTQLDGAVCLTDGDGASRVVGPLTVTTATGTITFAAPMTGVRTTPGDFLGPFDWRMTAEVSGGTGAYEGATGTLVLDLHVPFEFPLHWTGTVSGTITVPPHTPTSKDDCRDGGWRDVEDEDGNPFPNQGQCIAWVNHHT
jgi:hypothetical protein